MNFLLASIFAEMRCVRLHLLIENEVIDDRNEVYRH